LWVSDEKPDVKAYSPKYDNFTPDKEIENEENKPIVWNRREGGEREERNKSD